jgi:hypothetical protein
LYYIRGNSLTEQVAEDNHIFEFSSEDWKLIFQFAGWKVVYERVYFQYPNKWIYSLTKNAWKQNDFEGFYGVVLEKDDTYKKLYKDWD